MARTKKSEAEVTVVETVAVEETKAPAKKTTRKTSAKKAAETKTTEKKPTTRRKKEIKADVYVQFWGKEVHTADVTEMIKTIWTKEMGKKESEIKDLKIYIKPEDNGAHYVINDEIRGFVQL